MDKTILITGGAGFIGSHLADYCLNMGHRVTVFDNLSTGSCDNLQMNHKSLTFVKGDILDKNHIFDMVKQNDIIIHLAACVSVNDSVKNPDKTKHINIDGSFNILEACRIHKNKKIFFASSAAIYGQPQSDIISENHVSNPISPYGLEKLTIEHYLHLYASLYGVEYCTGRFFNIYGTRQNPSSPYSGVISIFAHALKYEQPLTIYGDGLQSRDFLYVGDLVKIIYHITLNHKNITVNCGTGAASSLHDLISVMVDVLGNNIPHIDYLPERTGDIKHSKADNGLLLRYMPDYVPTSLYDGLKILMAEYKS